MKRGLNSSSNDKIWDATKLKASADDKMKVVQWMIFVRDRIEIIVEKGENTCYQQLPTMFPQELPFSVFKTEGLCEKELMHLGTHPT